MNRLLSNLQPKYHNKQPMHDSIKNSQIVVNSSLINQTKSNCFFCISTNKKSYQKSDKKNCSKWNFYLQFYLFILMTKNHFSFIKKTVEIAVIPIHQKNLKKNPTNLPTSPNNPKQQYHVLRKHNQSPRNLVFFIKNWKIGFNWIWRIK